MREHWLDRQRMASERLALYHCTFDQPMCPKASIESFDTHVLFGDGLVERNEGTALRHPPRQSRLRSLPFAMSLLTANVLVWSRHYSRAY